MSALVFIEAGSETCCSGVVLALAMAGACAPTQKPEPIKMKAEQLATFALDGRLYARAFTADANALAWVSVSPPGNWPGEVQLWHSTAKKKGETNEVAMLGETKGMVYALAFTPDGRTLATGGSASSNPADPRMWEGIVKLWNVASGRELAVLKGHGSFVTVLKFSPDGKVLASATQSFKGSKWEIELKLWDILGRKELVTIRGNGYYESVLEFTPDGKTLAWGTQGVSSSSRWKPEIKLIDVTTGKELATLKGHTHVLKCLAFSPDGKTLASGGGLPPQQPVQDGKTRRLGRKALLEKPGELKLWDAATGKEQANLQGHSGCVLSVAFSPDGRTLAAGGAGAPMPAPDQFWYWSGEVKLWDVTTGKERVALRGHSFPKGTVQCVTFSADGTLLASAGGDAVKLWDTASGMERAEVAGHGWDNWVWVTFKGKGMILLSGHPDSAKIVGSGYEGLTIWDVPEIK
jgi:WD40 repeat protein